jgi:hypothetical protein
MSSLRELAIAKLRSQEPEAGQGPGQTTGQQVSRTGNLSEAKAAEVCQKLASVPVYRSLGDRTAGHLPQKRDNGQDSKRDSRAALMTGSHR